MVAGAVERNGLAEQRKEHEHRQHHREAGDLGQHLLAKGQREERQRPHDEEREHEMRLQRAQALVRHVVIAVQHIVLPEADRRALDGADYTAAMLEKHVWICAFMMVGALNGGVTVGDVESSHADELRPLVAELCAAGELELGVKLPAGAYDRLAAYGRSVAHFPTAVKEFEWRNGWFHAITQKALAAGRPDPMPLHTAGLRKLGIIEA